MPTPIDRRWRAWILRPSTAALLLVAASDPARAQVPSARSELPLGGDTLLRAPFVPEGVFASPGLRAERMPAGEVLVSCPAESTLAGWVGAIGDTETWLWRVRCGPDPSPAPTDTVQEAIGKVCRGASFEGNSLRVTIETPECLEAVRQRGADGPWTIRNSNLILGDRMMHFTLGRIEKRWIDVGTAGQAAWIGATLRIGTHDETLTARLVWEALSVLPGSVTIESRTTPPGGKTPASR